MRRIQLMDGLARVVLTLHPAEENSMDKATDANCWRGAPASTRRWRNSPTTSTAAAKQAANVAEKIKAPTDPAAEPWPPMRAGAGL